MNNKIINVVVQILAVISIGSFIYVLHKFGEYWLYDYLKMQADSYSNKLIKILIVGSPLFAIFMYIFLLNVFMWESFSKRKNTNE